MSCSKNLVLKSKQLLFISKFSSRCFASTVQKQDPEEVKKMPIFEYATENTKRAQRIYVWGNTMFGALGNPNFLIPPPRKRVLRTMHRPCKLQFADFHKVSDIACGYGFTVIAASNKETNYSLFGTGLNSDFQIGYQCARKDRPLETVLAPVPIALPLLNSSTKAIQLSCGRAHTVVLTDKEGIFSLGNNAYGQCGTTRTDIKPSEFSVVHKVEGFDEPISRVFCGQDHTLFLSSTGTVYSCGWGADGQTGLGHYQNQYTPAKVKGDIEGEKIVHLSCGADSNLAVSENGDVFGWGNGEYGQLRTVTDEQQVNIPRHLKFHNIGRVKKAACAGTMCALLTMDGSVYVYGYGLLGHGPNVSHLHEPTLLPQTLFGLNEFTSDVAVEQIDCGISHFAAVTNKGHLYMWGKNRDNCLGLGRTNDQYFPFKVYVPAEVKKISCGVDHTAVISKAFA